MKTTTNYFIGEHNVNRCITKYVLQTDKCNNADLFICGEDVTRSYRCLTYIFFANNNGRYYVVENNLTDIGNDSGFYLAGDTLYLYSVESGRWLVFAYDSYRDIDETIKTTTRQFAIPVPAGSVIVAVANSDFAVDINNNTGTLPVGQQTGEAQLILLSAKPNCDCHSGKGKGRDKGKAPYAYSLFVHVYLAANEITTPTIYQSEMTFKNFSNVVVRPEADRDAVKLARRLQAAFDASVGVGVGRTPVLEYTALGMEYVMGGERDPVVPSDTTTLQSPRPAEKKRAFVSSDISTVTGDTVGNYSLQAIPVMKGLAAQGEWRFERNSMGELHPIFAPNPKALTPVHTVLEENSERLKATIYVPTVANGNATTTAVFQGEGERGLAYGVPQSVESLNTLFGQTANSLFSNIRARKQIDRFNSRFYETVGDERYLVTTFPYEGMKLRLSSEHVEAVNSSDLVLKPGETIPDIMQGTLAIKVTENITSGSTVQTILYVAESPKAAAEAGYTEINIVREFELV